MGKKFADLTTLSAYKNKSQEIRTATIRAFAELVLSMKEDSFPFLAQRKDGEKRRYLPVRPLILGGDDMTFVCAAKVAFDCTAFIMKSLLEKGVDTCAGVAILPTAYPFFRGYEIAEQLCGAAKSKMRAMRTEGSSCWLDFAILHGEQPPTLEQIREQQYSGKCGAMHFGPYRVDGDASTPEYVGNLIEAVRQLVQGEGRMPMNKIKELRAVLAAGRHEHAQFMAQYHRLIASGGAMRLPEIAAWSSYRESLWQEGRTPYVDAIEMIDFYVPEEVQHG